MGIRGRLFVVSVVLIAVVGAVGAVWIQRALQVFVEERIEGELTRHADVSRVTLEHLDPNQEIATVDPLADALAGDGALRVTIIDADGRVTGDSELTPTQLRTLENHAGRPEVVQALEQGGPAIVHRHSDTLGRDMIYVAMPFQAPGHHGVIRTAMDLDVLDSVIRAFRLTLSIVGLLGLGFTVFMSGLASHLASRDVRAMLTRIRQAIARSNDAEPGTPGDEDPRAGDELAGLAGGVQDLADRLQLAVTELGSERARFRALLESMSEAVLALDPSTRITLANPAAKQLLGLEDSPTGHLLLEAVRSPGLSEVVRSALASDSGSGDTGSGEDASDELDLPGGQTVLATARPLPGQEGCVLVLHDITDARRLEKVRRDFVANVSHELRTPVAIIRANAESLDDGALEEPAIARSFLDAILRNAERLSALIGDLLDLSQIEAGRMALHPEQLRIADVARSVAAEVQPRASLSSQTIDLELDQELCAWADARALEHILLNLIENAVKYTPEGGSIRVTAAPWKADHTVRIAVEDDGPGIPERHRSRVFERFYRVDSGRARPQGGTGLGLAIVKHLAESMGGTVGLDPRMPRGSVFWVELPTRPPRKKRKKKKSRKSSRKAKTA